MPSTDPERRRYALGLLCVANFMVILDGMIVFVAVPSIARDLGLAAGAAQWVVSGYNLTFGGLLLLGGRAADLLGRRRVFMAGAGLFAAASLLCGLAPSGAALVAARAVQGCSAAIMAPAALALLLATFAEGAGRNAALGAWGAAGGIGGTAGALIGGLLTAGLGWPWIFHINVPVGLGLLALSPALLRESRAPARPRGFDLAGAATSTAALVLLVYAVAEVPAAGWASARTGGLLVAAVALLVLFARLEARSPAPLVSLGIFRSRTLVGGNLVIAAAGMAVAGMWFILTQYAQRVLGHSAVQFGLLTAVMPLLAVAGAAAGQRATTRLGHRPTAAASLALIGGGCLLLVGVSPGGGYVGAVLPGLVLIGIGLGAGMVAATGAALAGVAAGESGLASGLTTMAFRLGQALGIACAATVAVARADGILAGAGQAGEPLVALTAGFRAAFGATVVFALLGAGAALLLLAPPRTARRGAAAGARVPTGD